MTDFGARTDMIDAVAIEHVGDAITYTPHDGLDPVTSGYVDYGTAPVDFGAGHMVDQSITVEIRKADLAREPDSADRITLPRLPGKTFKPSGKPSTDASGTHWAFSVKEVT